MLAAVPLPKVLGGGHGPVGAVALDGARFPLRRVDLDGTALDAVLLGRPFADVDHLGLLPAHRRAVVPEEHDGCAQSGCHFRDLFAGHFAE